MKLRMKMKMTKLSAAVFDTFYTNIYKEVPQKSALILTRLVLHTLYIYEFILVSSLSRYVCTLL